MSKPRPSKKRAAEIRAAIAETEMELRVLRGQLGAPLTVAEIRKLSPEEARERWEEIRGELPDRADRGDRDRDRGRASRPDRDRDENRRSEPITAASASSNCHAASSSPPVSASARSGPDDCRAA